MTWGDATGDEESQGRISYPLFAALQEREHDLAEAQRLARLGSWSRDLATGVSVWSDELYRILGLDPSDQPGFGNFLARVHPDDRAQVLDGIRDAEDSPHTFELDFRLALDGEERWVHARGAVTADGAGAARSHVTLQDVSELATARRTAANLRRRCAALELSATARSLTVYDAAGHPGFSITATNDRSVVTAAGRGNNAAKELIHEGDAERVDRELARLRSRPGATMLCRYRVADGAGAWQAVEARGWNASDDPIMHGTLVAIHDVGVGGAFDRVHGTLSARDALTGLADHALLLDHARRAVARAERHGWCTAILVVDIDGFHGLNEAWGDDSGDTILVELAARLVQTFRATDAVGRTALTTGLEQISVARIGGDRFVAVCENVPDTNAARTVADRLRTVVAQPILLRTRDEVVISVGIGIAIAGQSGRSVEHRIRDAEDALRSAKEAGPGGCVIVGADAATDQEVRREAERALRRAFDADEFVLHYQPKLSLESDRITGVEALLRWQDPVRGLVPPLEFIPLAEQTGLIIPLGSWVIQQACMQIAQWQHQFPRQPPLVVSVNVSGRQFGPDLIAVVTAALAASCAKASQLCLEVTESILIADTGTAVQTLGGLATLGVKLSIDDFGTGYSSLSYLKRFPLHELKIDKSFVDGLGSDADDTAIIGATVAMAHALGLSVVAEGVETADQLNRLRVIGSQEAQGYFISRPTSAELVAELLGAERSSGWRPGPDPSKAGSPQAFRPQRILVVDDVDDVRQLARMSLAAAGFEIYEAASGAQAIEMAKDLAPDCVVLDVSMPQMSGIEVCRILRGDPTTAGCTILMLSANTGADEKIEAFAGGADDYIIKPFSPRDLVGRVRAALRRDTAADDTVPGTT